MSGQLSSVNRIQLIKSVKSWFFDQFEKRPDAIQAAVNGKTVKKIRENTKIRLHSCKNLCLYWYKIVGIMLVLSLPIGCLFLNLAV